MPNPSSWGISVVSSIVLFRLNAMIKPRGPPLRVGQNGLFLFILGIVLGLSVGPILVHGAWHCSLSLAGVQFLLFKLPGARNSDTKEVSPISSASFRIFLHWAGLKGTISTRFSTISLVSLGYYLLPSPKTPTKPAPLFEGSQKAVHGSHPGLYHRIELHFLSNFPLIVPLTLRELIARDIGLAVLTTDKPGYQDKNMPILYDTWLKGFEGANLRFFLPLSSLLCNRFVLLSQTLLMSFQTRTIRLPLAASKSTIT